MINFEVFVTQQNMVMEQMVRGTIQKIPCTVITLDLGVFRLDSLY